MNEQKKPYKEPETEIEILNAKLRISDWYVRKMIELNEKLAKLDEWNQRRTGKEAG